MARGRKTGGRNFRPGEGRPRGSINKVPAGFKPSIKAIYEKLMAAHPEEWESAIRTAIRKGGRDAFAHIQLAAHYFDGRPVERMEMKSDREVLIVDTISKLAEAKRKYPEEFQDEKPQGAAGDDPDAEVVLRGNPTLRQ